MSEPKYELKVFLFTLCLAATVLVGVPLFIATNEKMSGEDTKTAITDGLVGGVVASFLALMMVGLIACVLGICLKAKGSCCSKFFSAEGAQNGSYCGKESTPIYPV